MVLNVIDGIVNFFNLNFKSRKSKRVLMTGFGPFAGIESNPSWEAVEAVDTRNMKNGHKIILFKEKVAVRYVDVDLNVPKLLDIKKPHLTIHVGVSTEVKCLRLEKRAYKDGYIKFDNGYQKATQAKNPSPGPKFIDTSFDVEAIRNELNENRSKDDLEVEISENAYRFLCEYIYYTSLSLGRSPTLFVHVPPNKSPEQLARGLERIVELCLKHMQSINAKKC